MEENEKVDELSHPPLSEEEKKEKSITIYSTLWFVGLEFKTNNELVDLNLTDCIQTFTDMSKNNFFYFVPLCSFFVFFFIQNMIFYYRFLN
jgi:hypothetical protein